MKNLVKIQKMWAVALLTLAGFGMLACGSDNDDPTPIPELDATQVAIINQYVDNVVIITYKNLADKALELSKSVKDLETNKNQENVKIATEKWVAARKYWERSEAFLYGAAGDYSIDPHIDSWPLDKAQLDNILNNATIMKEFNANYAAENLAGGLLGFHAIEYVIFKGGADKPVSEISNNELKFATGIAEDLARQAVRLEAAWAGMENITTAKQEILTDAELEPTRVYGAELKAAGQIGNKKYSTLKSAFEEILGGAIAIADEVGNAKITDPVKSQDVLDVESWYSWNSLTDFQDNIISIKNAYLGGVEDKRDETKSVSSHIKGLNPKLDTEIKAAIDNAIKEIAAIGQPFRNHLADKEKTDKAIAACGALQAKLEAAKSALK